MKIDETRLVMENCRRTTREFSLLFLFSFLKITIKSFPRLNRSLLRGAVIFVMLYHGTKAKYFDFHVNEESCDNNNDNTSNYVDNVVVNERSLANDNVARRSVI